jgi:hypothetical protein
MPIGVIPSRPHQLPQLSLLPLLRLMDSTPLLPSLGDYLRQCLLRLEAVKLLLRGVHVFEDGSVAYLVDHPPQQMVGEIDERDTRSRYHHMSHFDQLLLLLLSLEMLGMLCLILTGSMLCMMSLNFF